METKHCIKGTDSLLRLCITGTFVGWMQEAVCASAGVKHACQWPRSFCQIISHWYLLKRGHYCFYLFCFQYIDLMSMYCNQLIYLEICRLTRFHLFSATVLARKTCGGATGFFKKPCGFCYQGLSTGFIFLKWIYFARGKGDFSVWLPIECALERLMFARGLFLFLSLSLCCFTEVHLLWCTGGLASALFSLFPCCCQLELLRKTLRQLGCSPRPQGQLQLLCTRKKLDQGITVRSWALLVSWNTLGPRAQGDAAQGVVLLARWTASGSYQRYISQGCFFHLQP